MTEPIQPDGGNTPMPVLAARALAAPASVDAAARTVEVVWSTGARARNFVPPLGPILEELDMSPAAVRMDGLRGGRAPVLDSHRRGGSHDVLGRVIAARLEAGRGYATLKFSRAQDVEPVWQRIADGTLQSISVGYRVPRYEPRSDPGSGETIHRAVDWEPYEISVVPVPIDPAAAIRGEDAERSPVPALEPSLITTLPEEPRMPEPLPAAAVTTETPAAPPAAPVNMPTPPMDAAAEAIRGERERIASLAPLAQAGRAVVNAPVVEALHQRAVAEGWNADALRGALWDAMLQGARPPAVPAAPAATGPSPEDPASIRDAMAEAIAVRAMPGYQPSSGSRHTEFLGWRPTEMVAELLRLRGERSNPRDITRLAERAFHTTSDFPLLLSAAANKMLLAAYQPAQPTYRSFFLRRDFRDFKPNRHLRIGDFPNLVKLPESGEITAGTMSESQELVFLETFARRIRVTRQMLVNDDLGAFTEFAAMIGRRIAEFENATAYSLVNSQAGSGPALADGVAVFAAARANQAPGDGTLLGIESIGQGRAAVMKQKTLDGLPIAIGQTMRLVTGPDNELTARRLTVTLPATDIAKVNVYAGSIQPVIDAQIPGQAWYLFADPMAAPIYVYGYLNGAEGPQVTTGPVSGVDGVEVSVIFDFGVGAIDWRGAWFNPGDP